MNILDYYIGARDKLISIEKAEAVFWQSWH